jgi:Holliday junction DNA helicase RuvB
MAQIVSAATMRNMVGQDKARRKLIIMCEGARGRGDTLRHVILVGPGGVGKTALARLIAACMDAPFIETLAGAVDNKQDMIDFLLGLPPHAVVFIDEFHGIKPSVRAQVLYSAMTDGFVMVKTKTGPERKPLNPFTLVAATTEGKLDPSMASRFTKVKLKYYTVDELTTILIGCALEKDYTLRPDAARYLAARSQGVARVGQEWLASAIDELHGAKVITLAHAVRAMEVAEIDDLGLGETEREILIVVAREAGEPIGLASIASLVGARNVSEEIAFLERIHLVKLNHRPRGRVALAAAYVHLDEDIPPRVRGRESE